MGANWFAAFALAVGMLCAATGVPAAEGEKAFKSGLYPGDKLFSFRCFGVTGPHKGKPLCYI